MHSTCSSVGRIAVALALAREPPCITVAELLGSGDVSVESELVGVNNLLGLHKLRETHTHSRNFAANLLDGDTSRRPRGPALACRQVGSHRRRRTTREPAERLG